MFRVRAKYLLLIAAAVWFLAGVNIMRLGVIACLEGDAAIWLLVIGIPVVFVVFHCMFSKLVGKHADRIRGYGDFLHYHLLARGAIDLVIESDLNILDIAALAVIVREAGGVFSDLDGQAPHLDTRSVLAGTPAIHAEALRRFAR